MTWPRLADLCHEAILLMAWNTIQGRDKPVSHSAQTRAKYQEFKKSAFAAGVIDERTKHLLHIAAALALRCED